MKGYCVVENNVITNMIVCESDEVAAELGALTSYDGAYIGGIYNPPPSPEPDPSDEPVTWSALAASIREGVNEV